MLSQLLKWKLRGEKEDKKRDKMCRRLSRNCMPGHSSTGERVVEVGNIEFLNFSSHKQNSWFVSCRTKQIKVLVIELKSKHLELF